MHKIFIDGGHGTTGLKISEYLCKRPDIEILEIDPDERKNTDARLQMIKEADVSLLCLPDKASEEIALLAPDDAVLIDPHATQEEDVHSLGHAQLAGDVK